jgi:UDP-2,3-diacylglucosamine pyrophosphatase LpxH
MNVRVCVCECMCMRIRQALAIHVSVYIYVYVYSVKLLVQHGADVNGQSTAGFTPLIKAASRAHLTVAQYLLEQKADVFYCMPNSFHDSCNALYWAMRKCATHRTRGNAFAFLCCDTDAKNVKIQDQVTTNVRDFHIMEYKYVQAYIDEYHRILNLVLSDHVQVDTRVGRGDYGIYQEPLERTLEYLGLSMSKDQVVNTSIDGEEAVKRALIPGHVLNANHWFEISYEYFVEYSREV